MLSVRLDNQVHEMDAERMAARAVIERLGLMVESTVVVRNGQVVSEEEMLRSGDEIEVIKAISGGST